MDGNQSERSGELEAPEPQSFERMRQRSTDSFEGVPGNRIPIADTHRAPPPAKPAIAFSPIPLADWKLFANLSLPGENAVYSLHDGNGRFLEATDACQRLWSRSSEEIQGQALSDFLQPGKKLVDWLVDLDPHSQPAIFSATALRDSQADLPVELKRIPLFIGNDPKQSRIVLKTVASETTLRDQSKSAPASKDLSFKAKDRTLDCEHPFDELLKASLDRVRESVILLVKDESSFPICYANRAFEEMAGFSASQISGQGISCLEGSKTDCQSISRIDAALNEEEELAIELLLYRGDGDPFWCKASFHPLRDTAGETRYFAAVLEDLTRERAVANELEEKNRELSEALNSLEESQKTIIQQESLRALGQMASGIAHDFNNLLAPILGFSELLLSMPPESRDDAKLESFLRKIQIAAQDGAAVVGRLREFYRAHNRDDEVHVTIDPKTLLSQVKDLTKHRWKNQAQARGANIEFEIDIRTQRRIRGNEPELRQSLANLVINAVDAIDENGAITISIEDQADRVRIQVKDTGKGMPAETREKCLDPFYTTKGKLGTGLGLSIVSGIVKRHGGELEVDSKEGVGTVIAMTLPAIEADLPLEKLAPLPLHSTPLNILLVDDEAVLLEVVSGLLGTAGHTVENFSNAESALEAFKKGRYDLVITDRAMPKMNGDQLAAEIKAINPDTPVYLMTGFGDFIEETGETLSNIDAILGKPVPLDVLNRKLSELISSKNS